MRKRDISRFGFLMHGLIAPQCSGEVGASWHMPELPSVAGSSGTQGLLSATPRSTGASGSGLA